MDDFFDHQSTDPPPPKKKKKKKKRKRKRKETNTIAQGDWGEPLYLNLKERI